MSWLSAVAPRLSLITSRQMLRQCHQLQLRTLRSPSVMTLLSTKATALPVFSRRFSSANSDIAFSQPTPSPGEPVVSSGVSEKKRRPRTPALDMLQENGQEFHKFLSANLGFTTRQSTDFFKALGSRAVSKQDVSQLIVTLRSLVPEATRKTIAQLLHRFPLVVTRPSEELIERFRDFSTVLGMSPKTTLKVLTRLPLLFHLPAETMSSRKQTLLKMFACTEEELNKCIAMHPQLLTYTEDTVQKKVEFYRSMTGLTEDKTNHMLLRAPCILSLAVSRLERQQAFLESFLKCPKDEFGRLTHITPVLFSCNPDTNLAPKLDYLLKESKLTMEELRANLVLLTLSLHKRIMPRTAILREKNTRPTPLLMKLPDERFCNTVKINVDEYAAIVRKFSKPPASPKEHKDKTLQTADVV